MKPFFFLSREVKEQALGFFYYIGSIFLLICASMIRGIFKSKLKIVGICAELLLLPNSTIIFYSCSLPIVPTKILCCVVAD